MKPTNPTTMFSEAHAAAVFRRYHWRGMAVVLGSTVPMFAYLAVLGQSREAIEASCTTRFGPVVSNVVMALLMLASIPIFIGTLAGLMRLIDLDKPRCPACGVELAMDRKLVMATRCCPACGSQIVEGQKYSIPAYRRLALRVHRRREFVIGVSALWVMVAMGAVFLAAPLLLGYPLLPAVMVGVTFPGLAFVAAGRSFYHTRDRRYLYPFGSGLLITSLQTSYLASVCCGMLKNLK